MAINLPKMAKKVPFQMYFEVEQYRRFKQLSTKTQIPMSAMARDAIDAYLNHIDAGEQHAEMGRPERAEG